MLVFLVFALTVLATLLALAILAVFTFRVFNARGFAVPEAAFGFLAGFFVAFVAVRERRRRESEGGTENENLDNTAHKHPSIRVGFTGDHFHYSCKKNFEGHVNEFFFAETSKTC